MKTIIKAKSQFRLLGICIILQISTFASGTALANGDSDGVLDTPPSLTSETDTNTQLSEKDVQQEVKKEEEELATLNRDQLEEKADNGERLAQVALGSDFASEAQLLTFAPAAANDAMSDALRWYSVAAKRGFPGALALDTSGVSYYPVRVVRNQ